MSLRKSNAFLKNYARVIKNLSLSYAVRNIVNIHRIGLFSFDAYFEYAFFSFCSIAGAEVLWPRTDIKWLKKVLL